MSQRAFRYFTIVAGGTPQPLIGTYLSASVKAGNNVSCPVGDSSMFQQGDRVLLQSKTRTNAERGYVGSVPDGTHIIVRTLTLDHTGGVFGTGEFVSLAEPINSIYVQSLDGNAAALYIGDRATLVKATGVGVIAKLQPVGAGVQPTEFSSGRSGLANVDNVGQLFIDGTTADSYLPSIGQV